MHKLFINLEILDEKNEKIEQMKKREMYFYRYIINYLILYRCPEDDSLERGGVGT